MRSPVLLITVATFVSALVVCESASLGQVQISVQDRPVCLEKLICGISLVSTKSSSKENYRDQVDLIRRYFSLYPLVGEAEGVHGGNGEEVKVGETQEADDEDSADAEETVDYGTVDLEDIVHQPQTKRPVSTKRKKTKTPSSTGKKKVVFGSGLPISETISLVGRRIKPKRTPKDPNRLTLARASRALGEWRQGRKKSCSDILCPHSFKSIYESLQERLEPERPDLSEQVSALATQNARPGTGAYSLSQTQTSAGLEGFLSLPNPSPAKRKKVSKKKKKVVPTVSPLTKSKKKKPSPNTDLIGTIAPPTKVINYRPPPVSAEEDSGEDDEQEEINKTYPVQLVGHPDHDPDVHQQRPYHRVEDDDEVSEEPADDYDEEAKYEVPVDYGNDEEEDDDVSEEDVRPKPKQKKKKKGTNGSLDTVSVTRRKPSKKKVEKEAESSEEEDDELDDDEIDIENEHYASVYSRDPMNIGGRPMTPPGDIPIEMTSLGMRQRSGGGKWAQPQPNLHVREPVHPPPKSSGGRRKGGAKKHGGNNHSPAVQEEREEPSGNTGGVMSSSSPDMSTGLSLSRLASPFQSLFKLVREGNMFQQGGGYTPSHPHYQNQRPSAFNQHQQTQGPSSSQSAESVSVPVPVTVPVARPVGPESSNFKRYKIEKKKKTKGTAF